MSDYRPICDTWWLARPKVAYYGAYPSGFVHRARALLAVTINDALLHVCAGRVRDYPFHGVGPNDRALLCWQCWRWRVAASHVRAAVQLLRGGR